MERAGQALSPRPPVTGRDAAAVLARPWLWPELLKLAPARWWRRRPYLPVPSPDYLAFRMETMYGRADAAPDPADVVEYLEWCRTMRRLAR